MESLYISLNACCSHFEVLRDKYHLYHAHKICAFSWVVRATGRELCSKNASSSLNCYPVHTLVCIEDYENANCKGEHGEVENALEFVKRINVEP